MKAKNQNAGIVADFARVVKKVITENSRVLVKKQESQAQVILEGVRSLWEQQRRMESKMDEVATVLRLVPRKRD